MLFTIAAVVLVLATPCTSWTTSAYMNLVSPPRWTTDIGDAYIVKAGVRQPGYANHMGSCLNKPTPSNVTRTPFPISGGSLIFSFVNDTASPNPDPTNESFAIDMYFTDDHVNYSPDYFFRWGGLVRRMTSWQGFETGWTCNVPFDMTSMLRQPGNETAVRLLEGFNLTIALLVTARRSPWNIYEEVDQCAYVTLTSNTPQQKSELKLRDQNQDMCNRVNLDYFATSTTSSALPTATSSASAQKMIRHGTPRNLHIGTAFICAVLGIF